MFAGTSEWCEQLWNPSLMPLLRIKAIAELAREQQRRDAREVRCPSQREQVEHQRDVLFEIRRHAVRLLRHVEIC